MTETTGILENTEEINILEEIWNTLNDKNGEDVTDCNIVYEQHCCIIMLWHDTRGFIVEFYLNMKLVIKNLREEATNSQGQGR